jgi:hypothetical protein
VDDKPAGGGKRFVTYARADGSTATLQIQPAVTARNGFHHDDLVMSALAPQWGYARVVGVDEEGRLWLHFQTQAGAVTTESGDWEAMDLKLVRSSRDPGAGGASTNFRLPLERGTRVVRGPHVSGGGPARGCGGVEGGKSAVDSVGTAQSSGAESAPYRRFNCCILSFYPCVEQPLLRIGACSGSGARRTRSPAMWARSWATAAARAGTACSGTTTPATPTSTLRTTR